MSDSSNISDDIPGKEPGSSPADAPQGASLERHVDEIVHPTPDICPKAEPDMSNVMDSRDILQMRLAELRRKHREMDHEIDIALSRAGVADALEIRRLKKRKLAFKDQIAKVEDQLMPDIIA